MGLSLMTQRAGWSGLVCTAALVACALVRSAQAAPDANTAPDVLVKEVVSDVMQTAKTDPAIQAGNMDRINALVEQKILPYVDFTRMTASAVGRNWNQATPEQKQQITEQFKKLLTFTYAGALAQVRNQTIQYKPFRSDPGASTVQVNTDVLSDNGSEPLQLEYKLTKEADGWKIIDVNVLGVWLVQNYRNTFAQQVSAGGIDGLIKALTDKNAQLAANNKA